MGRAVQQHLDWLARSLGRSDYAPLTQTDIELIRRVGESVSRKSGFILFSEGDDPAVIYLLEQGEAEISRGPSGRRRVVAHAGPGSMLGDLAVFGDRPYTFTARASGQVRVLRLDRIRLLAELARQPALLMRWLVAGQHQLEKTQRRVLQLMHKTVLAQVADVLLEESETREEVNLSQATIANLLGVSRQSVNEALGRLREQGLVSTGYRTIRVLDPERLQRIAQS